MLNNDVMLNYNKLWKILVEKNVNKTQLHNMAQISTNAVAKMGKNKPVSLETIVKICCALECEIGDVVEIVWKNN